MALDLNDNLLGQEEHRLSFDELLAMTEGMSLEESNDFLSSLTIKSFGDEKFNSSGELVVDPIFPQQSYKFVDTDDLKLNSDVAPTAYPLKLNSENTSGGLNSNNWSDNIAQENEQTWDIQTTNGPATTNINPNERTVLYTDENGDPVYSNVDGDYLYDDYNGNPVYYDTNTAIANGADAITYGEGGGTNNTGASSGSGGLSGGVDSLSGLVGGSSKGSKDGGTGAQVGENNGTGTRLTNPDKNTNAADYTALQNYALIVNENLINKIKWQTNPLDRYTTYAYRLEWFSIDVDLYQAFQDSANRVEFLKQLDDSQKFILFRTGINSDISIDNLEIKNYYGSNSIYKNVIFTELNMVIHEPSGASLLEVIKEFAVYAGYINMASMPYFLKITYVGYVGDGSEDDGQQEILNGYDTYIPFVISKFTPTINLDTKYVIQGHPLSVLAVLKDSFVLKTDISIDIPAGSDLGMMLEAVGKEVNRQYVESCSDFTRNLYQRANKNSSKVYQYAGENLSTAIYIDVDPDIARIPIDNNKVKSQFPELANNGIALTLRFANGTSLNKIFDEIRKIVSFSSILHGNIFEARDGSIASPKDWAAISKTFSFIPETRFVGQDPDTYRTVNSFVYKVFQKYNPAYMPPFDMLKPKDQAAADKAKYRQILCDAILEKNSLVKRYDSYNTGLNDQVLNVNINMDHLFFVNIPTKDVISPSADIKQAVLGNTQYKTNREDYEMPSDVVNEVIEENANLSGMLQQRDTVRYYGRNNSGDSSSGSDRALNSIYNEIYRSGGMIQLNLTIKGDPYWISNFSLLRNTLSDKEDNKTCHFKDGLLHLYFKATLPRVTQDYHNDPDGGESVYKGVVNKTITGVYMVISVTSQFNAGKFTQVIDCVMNNNLPLTFNGNIINLNEMPKKSDTYQTYQYTNDNQSISDQGYTDSVENTPNLKPTSLGNSPLPTDSFRISSGFGPRTAPTDGASTMHNGVDLAAKAGTPVYSAGDGTVTEVGYARKSGNYVKVKHADGYESVYLHLSNANVKQGQTISGGERLGAVGNTGVSTGSHLHFGVKKDGQWINPESLV